MGVLEVLECDGWRVQRGRKELLKEEDGVEWWEF